MNLYRLRLLFVLILFSSFVAAQDTLVITNENTGLIERIAYDDIIIVQPDRTTDQARLIVGPTYSQVIALESYDDVVDYQFCSLLSFTNRISGLRTAVPFVHVDTVLNTGSLGGATINVSEVRFGYSAVFSTVEKYQSVFAQYYECDQIAGRAVYDVVNVGYGLPLSKGVFGGKLQLKTLVAGNNVTLDERATTVVINSAGTGEGGSSPTDISVTQGAVSATISSSTGADAPLVAVNGTNAGLMLPAQNDKLAGIEANATADQTGTEIVSSIDGELASTDWRTNTGGVTNLAYTPSATNGTVTSSTGTNATVTAVDGTNAGLMLPAQSTKLAGIEAGADVTDATNVNAAGAVMLSDAVTTGMNFVIDEDDMISDLATKVPTQQSVKAYVDDNKEVNVTTNPASPGTDTKRLHFNANHFQLSPSINGGTGDVEHVTVTPFVATDFSFASDFIPPSIDAVVDYVAANAGGAPHVKQTTNKAMIHAKAGTTTYAVANGVGTLTIAEFGDISQASIIVNKSTDALNGAFTLAIDFTDNSVNTWDVSGGVNFATHDLYVPQFRLYDVGATALMVAELTDKSSDQTNGVFPSTISWAAGVLSITFASGTSFDSISQMLVELHFPKTK